MEVGDLSVRLSSARHEAGSDDDTVTAVVDGSGQVVEVRLEPTAMRLDSQRLGEVVTEALRRAQTAARDALPEVVGSGGAATPDTASLTRLADELGAGAQQRLADISSTLDRLLARGGEPTAGAGSGV